MDQRLSNIRDNVLRISGSISERRENLKVLVAERNTLAPKLKANTEAIQLAKKCLEHSLEKKKYIEEIVSSGLTEVFGTKHTFVLEPVQGADGIIKGLKPKLKEEHGELDDPLTSFGAGAQAISSLCFRITLLLLSSDTERLLILDEPLANVSPLLMARFGAFIDNICKTTGLQLILVTHTDIEVGTTYQVAKETKNNRKISSVNKIVIKEDL
jgi:ABC-type molybdenum transport system ATPase subunit/photorepair protein PhrA